MVSSLPLGGNGEVYAVCYQPDHTQLVRFEHSAVGEIPDQAPCAGQFGEVEFYQSIC